MTTLLIDLGNTALKWTTLEEPDNPHMIVHRGSTHFMDELYDLWLRMRPVRIIGCSVAASNVAFSLTKFFNEHKIVWNWVRSQSQFIGDFQIRNEYANPRQLGADRWFAAIGAVDTMPESSLLVVHTGTATTVDSIVFLGNREYVFKGGRIAPGPSLMHDSLTRGIPSLPDELSQYQAYPARTSEAITREYVFKGGRIAPGPSLMHDSLTRGIPSLPDELSQYQAYPARTSEAITAGIIDAQVGLILRAKHAMEQKGVSPRVVLAGGAAQFIAPYLREELPNLNVRHNLVLRGLAALARGK